MIGRIKNTYIRRSLLILTAPALMFALLILNVIESMFQTVNDVCDAFGRVWIGPR